MPRRLRFERAVHPLVRAVLFGVARYDPFDPDAKPDPPQRQRGKPCQTRRSERAAVVRAVATSSPDSHRQNFCRPPCSCPAYPFSQRHDISGTSGGCLAVLRWHQGDIPQSRECRDDAPFHVRCSEPCCSSSHLAVSVPRIGHQRKISTRRGTMHPREVRQEHRTHPDCNV